MLTVLNVIADGEFAPDLEHGPDSWWDCTNFLPFIADFLTEDVGQLEERKAGVAEPWWTRTWELGEQYIKKHGHLARDGRPSLSWVPVRSA